MHSTEIPHRIFPSCFRLSRDGNDASLDACLMRITAAVAQPQKVAALTNSLEDGETTTKEANAGRTMCFGTQTNACRVRTESKRLRDETVAK